MGALVSGAHRPTEGKPSDTHTHQTVGFLKSCLFCCFLTLNSHSLNCFAASHMGFDTFDSPSFSLTQCTATAQRERERENQIDCGRLGEGGEGMVEGTRTITKAKST